jgi:hypothetical protein
MICHSLNKLTTKKKAYCFFVVLFTHACWVTVTTELKIIGKGYRRNLFSVAHLYSVSFRTAS